MWLAGHSQRSNENAESPDRLCCLLSVSGCEADCSTELFSSEIQTPVPHVCTWRGASCYVGGKWRILQMGNFVT